MKTMILFLSAFFLFGLFPISAQEYPVYNFNQLQPRLNLHNDTLYVVNFWAMWCKPCVEELPYFEQVHKQFLDQKVKMLLVSLDFGNNLQQRLHNFLQKKIITAEVVILDDPDANAWIGKVDPHWDGAIPATLLFKGDKRKFFAKQVSYQELEEAIASLRE